MRKFLISLIASCACSVITAAQTDIYVTPRGDDSAPGTIDRPVATLSRAMLLAGQRAAHDDVTIYCREGKHRLTQPLEIGPDIKADGANRLTIRSYPGFIDAAIGDYRVNESSDALKTGFCNFAMDRFGVTYPPLLALAERPVIPEINNLLHDGRPSAALMKWNGVTFKTITTEGERSATGIASRSRQSQKPVGRKNTHPYNRQSIKTIP